MGEGERQISVSSGQTCNVDRRASDFNVLGARLCNFRPERRKCGLGVGESERRVSTSSGQTSNVDRCVSDLNVLGAELCNFVTPKLEGRTYR